MRSPRRVDKRTRRLLNLPMRFSTLVSLLIATPAIGQTVPPPIEAVDPMIGTV
jgi:hypothetical protein